MTIDKEKRNLSKEQIENIAENADIEDYKSLMVVLLRFKSALRNHVAVCLII